MKNIFNTSFLFTLLVVIGFLFSNCASVQSLAFSDDLIITEIIESDRDSNELFIIANEWFVSTVRDARVSIEFSDKEDGKIIGDVIHPFDPYLTASNDLYLNINFTIKDKKLRMVIKLVKIVTTNIYGHILRTNDYFTYWTGSKPPQEQKEAVIALEKEIIEDFKKFLLNYDDSF